MKRRRMVSIGNPQLATEFQSIWDCLGKAAAENEDARFRLLQCDQLIVNGVRFRGVDGVAEIVNPGETAGGSSHLRLHQLSSSLDHGGEISDPQHGSRGASLHSDSHTRQHTLSSASDHTGTLIAEQHSSNLDGSHYIHVQIAGHLGGTPGYPDVRGIRETGGPTLLTMGSIVDGEYLKRSGTGVASGTPGGGQAFPVGSVFLAVVSTNPNTLLGYGTWSQIAQGKFLVGQDGTDTAFDVAEETGGAKIHTHAIHTTGGAHTHDSHTFVDGKFGGLAGSPVTGPTTHSSQGGHTHDAHDSPSHLPPFLVCYIWKRTA